MSSSVSSSEEASTSSRPRPPPPPGLEHPPSPTSTENTEEAQLNPTVETLAEGICGLLGPTLEGLESRVSDTKEAQRELKDQIGRLTQDLEEIAAAQREKNREQELEAAIQKLNQSKKRVVVVANLLQGAQVWKTEEILCSPGSSYQLQKAYF